MTNEQTKTFARSNQKAMLLLLTATHDYAAARCLLLNGLFSGLPVGAQAIEKFLKASILFAEPTKNIPNTHHLPRLLAIAEGLIPDLIPLSLSSTAQHFYECYQTRYPDNSNQPISMDTGKREQLDEMVIAINSHLPCPRNVKMRSGLFAGITFSLNRLNSESPTERWVKQGNLALALVWRQIERDYFETMKELYPQTPELHS